MRIGVIVDDLKVAQWQWRALEELSSDNEVVFYNCLNGQSGKRRLKHALYYALNLLTVRNPLTRLAPIGEMARRTGGSFDFDTEYEGAWQRLPPALLERIAADRPAVLLKFGLNLLRVPPPERLAPPILSYHHGDPEHYRGRPAGFWELLHGRRTLGQMVQILSNKLDAGALVAFAETKVHPHSYRATLMEAYRASPLILRPAIAAAVAGKPLAKPVGGPNYRLPGNGVVLRFCARMARAAAQRVYYGALREKRWQVSSAPANVEALLDPDAPLLPPPREWRTLPCPRGYTFLADPFFAPDGESVLVEALNGRSGKGEILKIAEAGEPVRLSDPNAHYSYPATVEEGGAHYVVPETVFWSAPLAYRRDDWSNPRPLDIAGAPHLLDPTFVRHEGALYLFANIYEEGSGILRLWRSNSLFGRFEEHPASPVRISPGGSRMAGDFLRFGDRLLRLGQDDSGGYGDGLMVFAVEELGPDRYRETMTRIIRFDEVRGPHTLNFRGGTALFDWYRDRFSLLAGVRRIRGRLHSKSRSGSVSAPSVGQRL